MPTDTEIDTKESLETPTKPKQRVKKPTPQECVNILTEFINEEIRKIYVPPGFPIKDVGINIHRNGADVIVLSRNKFAAKSVTGDDAISIFLEQVTTKP